jgi:hypothetical protein
MCYILFRLQPDLLTGLEICINWGCRLLPPGGHTIVYYTSRSGLLRLFFMLPAHIYTVYPKSHSHTHIAIAFCVVPVIDIAN